MSQGSCNLGDGVNHPLNRLGGGSVSVLKENPVARDERWNALAKNLVDATSIWVQRINNAMATDTIKEGQRYKRGGQ